MDGRIGSKRVRRLAGPVGAGLLGALALATAAAQTPEPRAVAGVPAQSPTGTPDLEITDAAVRHDRDLDLLVFELVVAGEAGATTPVPRGAFDGAPVLGYVVPTDLPPAAVGFVAPDGLVALAVTAHPDFDDTPLFDESGDGAYANDGELWHAHWVLLGPDERVSGGLAVLPIAAHEAAAVLPPTNPGLPLYLDSPGFPVQLRQGTLRVVVPAPRVGGQVSFGFDAATAYLQVNTSDPGQPTLGVHDIYGVLSGDLSLPFRVGGE